MPGELILNRAHYTRVLSEVVPTAKRFLWIATADLKDLHVQGAGKRFVPFVGVLAGLVAEGVEVRLIHAKEPGPRFRADFDRHPELVEGEGFERILCPRMHMKVIIVDGRIAYFGSANLTGAGIGSKSENRRNFEAGWLTDEADKVAELMEFFDTFYLGDHCVKCGRREHCPDPIC